MTIRVSDVAALAKVSPGTVSNVLNQPEKVSEATRARVHDAIEKLGFVRNDAARQLRVGHSRSFGLVLMDVANPFFSSIARGAEDAAEEMDNAVLLGNSDQSVQRETRYLELFEEQRVRGILISPVRDVTGRLERLKRRGIPVVLVDRPGLPGQEWSSVSVDDVLGGEMAVRHLIERGCRRIAFVGGQTNLRQTADRLEGTRRAVAAHPGVTLEILLPPGFTVMAAGQIGEEIVARAPADRPDGIFAANDLYAVGLLHALTHNGRVRVPDDIAIIGYDDIDFAAAAVIPLSSIRQPSQLLGRTAIDLLEAEIASLTAGVEHEHRHIVFQPELVIRRSTGG